LDMGIGQGHRHRQEHMEMDRLGQWQGRGQGMDRDMNRDLDRAMDRDMVRDMDIGHGHWTGTQT
jgi:hypothetical protein